jgi:hypothetical protein
VTVALLATFVILAPEDLFAQTWDGGGADNNWSTAANWSGNAVPTGTAAVIFDGTSTKDCTIDNVGSWSSGSLTIAATYTGTVTQNVAVILSSFTQNAGTFTGGSAELRTSSFTLAGGTFNAPTGNLTIYPTASANATVFTYTAGTFNHSNGTLRFRNPAIGNGTTYTYTISLASALTVNNLQYEASISAAYNDRDRILSLTGAAAKFIVLGDFTMRRATGFTPANLQGGPYANGGTIELRGNAVIDAGANAGSTLLKFNGTGTQTYSSNGGLAPAIEIDKTAGSVSAASGTTDLTTIALTLTQGTFNAPTGNLTIYPTATSHVTVFTYTAGTFNHSNGTLRFRNPAISPGLTINYTISLASALTVNNLQYEASISAAYNDRDRILTLAGSAAKFIVLGDFTMRRATGFTPSNLQGAQPTANGGTIEVQGNLVIDTGANSGTTLIKLNGTGNQTYSSNGGLAPAIEIDKTAGNVSAASGTTDLTTIAFTALV